MSTRTTDVVDILTTDHREALDLIGEIRAGGSADKQRELADVLIAELVRHSVAEETVVYPVMRRRLPDGDESVEHDLKEHADLEHLLADLAAADPDEGSFVTCVEELQTQLEHHISDEESEQFPTLRENVPDDELRQMADGVEAIKAVAPTRPHPEAPDSPLFHLTVGPGVGMVDRLRDALSGRTTDPDKLS